jgi:hypothetical protein
MKLNAMEKLNFRIDCIKNMLPEKRDDKGNIVRHDWKVYKTLMQGKYNSKKGIVQPKSKNILEGWF